MYLGQIDLLLDLLGWISNADSVLKLALIYMSLGKVFLKCFPFAPNIFLINNPYRTSGDKSRIIISVLSYSILSDSAIHFYLFITKILDYLQKLNV